MIIRLRAVKAAAPRRRAGAPNGLGRRAGRATHGYNCREMLGSSTSAESGNSRRVPAVIAALLVLFLAGAAAGALALVAATGHRRPPPESRRAEAAFELPASGSPEPAAEGAAPAKASFDPGAAMGHIAHLCLTIGDREQGTAGEAEASGYVIKVLSSLGYQVSTQAVPITAGGRMTANVIARAPGTSRPGRTLVLGAHVDSVGGPGANDNATGVGVLLELARVARANMKHAPAIEFVFFGGEETTRGAASDAHHWGSRYYVNNLPSTDRAAICGMISVDMVGAGSSFYLNSTGDGPRTLVDQLLEAGSGLGLSFRKDPGWSDHEPFEREGIPSAWLEFTGGNPYHEPADDYDSVDASHVRIVGTLLQQYLEVYLTPERVDGLRRQSSRAAQRLVAAAQ